MLAARLLPPPVRTAEMDPRLARDALLPGEESAVSRAVEPRRKEFSAGRECARRALAGFGLQGAAIPQGPDRAPVWPDGIVGSITHTAGWCAAAVARLEDGVQAVGLDVELAEPIDLALTRIICTDEERRLIGSRAATQRGLLARLIFSAKESAYKCQYRLSRKLLGFHDMQIHLDEPRGRFVAVFRKAAAPFSVASELEGRFAFDRGLLMTAVALRS